MGRVTVTERVRNAMLEQLMTGQLMPGEHVTEVRMCTALGVSPSPVRSAMQMLAAQGLLDKHEHRGCFVPRTSPAQFCDLSYARAAVEGMAARCMAVSDHDEHLARLREIDEHLAATSPPYPMLPNRSLHAQFHLYLVHNCGNKFVAEQMNADALILRAFVFHPSSLVSMPADQDRVPHRDLIAAMADGDPDVAERCARDHIQQVIDHMRQFMSHPHQPVGAPGRAASFNPWFVADVADAGRPESEVGQPTFAARPGRPTTE